MSGSARNAIIDVVFISIPVILVGLITSVAREFLATNTHNEISCSNYTNSLHWRTGGPMAQPN